MTFAEAALLMMGGEGTPNIQSLSITENGEYRKHGDIDGFEPIYVTVPDRYDEGFADGEASVEENITELSITANGTYKKEIGGYNPVYVNVPDRYNEGYQDGVDSVSGGLDPADDGVLQIGTVNGTYTFSYAYAGDEQNAYGWWLSTFKVIVTNTATGKQVIEIGKIARDRRDEFREHISMWGSPTISILFPDWWISGMGYITARDKSISLDF